ncbi:MAG: hypothetical protein APR63_13590 [Desulfuromonas sp. SDB]|nr:MAG: hypothetical protein APR63_13590 [Desulfuromonas sp. SDB]
MVRKILPLVLFLFTVFLMYSCSKSSSTPLDQIEDLSGEYISYGDNYQASTVVVKMNDDVYKMVQEGVESDIEGILLKQDDMLYGAMQDEQGVAVAIYQIKSDQICGMWYAGEGGLLPEVISKQTVEEVKGFEIKPLTGVELHTLYEVRGEIGGNEYNSILYIEPYGENTYDLLWEDAEGIQIGIGIVHGNSLTVAFFSEDYKFWGVTHYKIDDQGNLQGEWSSYGNWMVGEEFAEGVDSLQEMDEQVEEN